MGEAAARERIVPARPAALSELPGERELMERSRGENFRVASLLLPPRKRAHLLAVYGYARLVDQIGDAVSGDRLLQLDALEADLRRLYTSGDEPSHPVLIRLAPSVRLLELPPEPFVALIQANRQDQLKTSYATYEELLGYCTLSANPVGELVLRIFDAASARAIALSNAVCTALQLTEHWQDIGEDHAAGRVYLPAEDLARFGVGDEDLCAAQAGERLRQLLAFEVERARALLDEGAPLVGTLSGAARIAVAGYVGGGRAALEAIEAAGFDVLSSPVAAGKRSRASHTIRTYRRGA